MKTVVRGHRGSSGACYNRRYISDLGELAACAKMNQHFHRHSQGTNVKWIVQSGDRPQNVDRAIKQRDVKWHLNYKMGMWFLPRCGEGWARFSHEILSEHAD